MFFNMTLLHNLLPHYQNILSKKDNPFFVISKRKPVHFLKTDSTKCLWEKHQAALKTKYISKVPPQQSLLDLKIEIASRMHSNCNLCENNCQINRNNKSGLCQVITPKIASEFLHNGEECFFVPSHTVFFSGCTFQCIFCQNWQISQNNIGIYIPPIDMTKRIMDRHQQGSKNVNWVGGDPTPNILYILLTLKDLNLPIPQIWNSNMYCSIDTMNLLYGVIDVYLADFKFGNDCCAKTLSNTKEYITIITRNLILSLHQSDLLIRHLILPDHVSCCSLPIISWIHKHLQHIPLNIMKQYRPCYYAKNMSSLNRTVTTQEYNKVIQSAIDKQLIIV